MEEDLEVDLVGHYWLPEVEFKMYRHDGIHWLVTRLDKVHPQFSKAILCVSFEHASEIFSGCLRSENQIWKN